MAAISLRDYSLYTMTALEMQQVFLLGRGWRFVC